jgi:hypothetical protein
MWVSGAGQAEACLWWAFGIKVYSGHHAMRKPSASRALPCAQTYANVEARMGIALPERMSKFHVGGMSSAWGGAQAAANWTRIVLRLLDLFIREARIHFFVHQRRHGQLKGRFHIQGNAPGLVGKGRVQCDFVGSLGFHMMFIHPVKISHCSLYVVESWKLGLCVPATFHKAIRPLMVHVTC